MKSRDEIARMAKKYASQFTVAFPLGEEEKAQMDEIVTALSAHWTAGYEQGAKDALEVAAKEVTEYLRKGR